VVVVVAVFVVALHGDMDVSGDELAAESAEAGIPLGRSAERIPGLPEGGLEVDIEAVPTSPPSPSTTTRGEPSGRIWSVFRNSMTAAWSSVERLKDASRMARASPP